MVRHVVFWNYDEKISNDERIESSKKIKSDLEALGSVVDGVVSIEVSIDALDSSNVDIMLYSLFESKEALINYQNHPEHKKVGEFVKVLMCSRKCFDSVE
ncbi:Dabb family protein [Metaclostridioides mangenotii]|uniref:Dabb family protein n=1 Tax=Metaclostridioides mangenotii TaxID=1540 RepID=UPI000485BE3F|nr:Dabb family protein [Clostridioides mangenotii]